jgi:hypothetical protein
MPQNKVMSHFLYHAMPFKIGHDQQYVATAAVASNISSKSNNEVVDSG